MIKKNGENYILDFKKILLIGIILSVFPVVLAITWSGDTGTVFNTGAGVLCVINSSGNFWTQGDNIINSSNNCYVSNGVNSQGNPQTTCCSAGYSCNQTSNACQFINTVNSCDDYNTESECSSYNLNLVKDSIEENSGLNVGNFCDQEYVNLNTCKYYGGCGCKWKNNECIDSYISDDPCDDSGGNIRRCEITKNEVIDKCSEPENSLILSWERKLFYTNGSLAPQQTWCTSGSKEFPCPEQRSLPFFNALNLAVTSLLISMIYLFFIRKREEL